MSRFTEGEREVTLGRVGDHGSSSSSPALLETWTHSVFRLLNTCRHLSALGRERAREFKKDWLSWFCKSLCINIWGNLDVVYGEISYSSSSICHVLFFG